MTAPNGVCAGLKGEGQRIRIVRAPRELYVYIGTLASLRTKNASFMIAGAPVANALNVDNA